MPQALYEVLEGLESLLSPEEEDPPELLDAELFESSLAGLLGGGDAGRAACMHIPFPCMRVALCRRANIALHRPWEAAIGCAS